MAGLSRVYGVDGDAVEEKKRNCEPIGLTWLAFYILLYMYPYPLGVCWFSFDCYIYL
jgi:hypothetical protein